jgi:hypothetical protein
LLEKLGVNLGSFKFSYITGDFRCVPGHTLQDIVKGLLFSLNSYLQKNNEITKEIKESFEINLKLLKYTHEQKVEKRDINELTFLFVNETETMYRQVEHLFSGVCFLIDEIDTLEPTIDIASFLKSVMEKFRLDGFSNISFIVSGVTGTITSLIAQHPSASRLFEGFQLEPMERNELIEIIDTALFDTGVDIDADAKERIISLSNDFPQPVHLLGYHSFRLDTDNYIDILDVNNARNFIIQNIKKQEFEDRFQQIGKGVAAEILKVMARAMENHTDLNYIVSRLPQYPADVIAGNMSPLLDRFIERTSRSLYKFKDPLFKTYLRWVFDLD